MNISVMNKKTLWNRKKIHTYTQSTNPELSPLEQFASPPQQPLSRWPCNHWVNALQSLRQFDSRHWVEWIRNVHVNWNFPKVRIQCSNFVQCSPSLKHNNIAINIKLVNLVIIKTRYWITWRFYTTKNLCLLLLLSALGSDIE